MSDDPMERLVRSLKDDLDAVERERDRLQARIDAYEGDVQEWEEVTALIEQSSLGGPEARARRDQVPPLLGKVVAQGSRYYLQMKEVERERDGLGAVVDALKEYLAAHTAFDAVYGNDEWAEEKFEAMRAAWQHVVELCQLDVSGELPWAAEGPAGDIAERRRARARCAWLRRAYGKLWLERAASRTVIDVYQDLWAERDRLRTVVDAARVYCDIMLRERVEQGWLDRANKAANALMAQVDALDVSGEVTDG